jgi:hypothetical protein
MDGIRSQRHAPIEVTAKNGLRKKTEKRGPIPGQIHYGKNLGTKARGIRPYIYTFLLMREKKVYRFSVSLWVGNTVIRRFYILFFTH